MYIGCSILHLACFHLSVNSNQFDASKSGVAQETIQNTIRRGSKIMTEQEARQILGVTEETAWEEIVKKYETLFERNAKMEAFTFSQKFTGLKNV
ncbi:hypothetical protein GH714_009041 [Hevea brasiliensis]|uniref:Mitochondrial import inner membrane translocase subunit Tim16 n=1 Tax=Hevea brasiliensis TaxID=3981 RepID=A0A6A6NCK1_HEVBR|nr:hypothetical protein GH714_009041 [Hevea brasiliensis]